MYGIVNENWPFKSLNLDFCLDIHVVKNKTLNNKTKA